MQTLEQDIFKLLLELNNVVSIKLAKHPEVISSNISLFPGNINKFHKELFISRGVITKCRQADKWTGPKT